MSLTRLRWVAVALALLALMDMPVRFSHGQEGADCVTEPALAAGTTGAAADDVAEVAEEERSEETAVSDVPPLPCPPAEAEAGPVAAAVPTETPIAPPAAPPAPAAAARATASQAVALLPPLKPGPGAPAVALFQKPFGGEFVVTNFFDHDLPFQFTDTNGHQLTWWGDRTRNIDGHSGYDWRMDEGTPIFAVADGEVVVAGDDRKQCPLLGHETTGLHVIVEHRASTSQGELVLRSRYSHFTRIDVQVAERVKQGAQIGISGNTGCSTGPHLHFEVQRFVPATRRFVRIDPYGWEGTGPDPWARHPEGAQSLWLWKDGQAPALFRENRSRPNEPTGNARVAITAVRWMGYDDETTPNNEFVELTLDPRFAPGGTVDLTNFTLVNNRGDTFRFPARFVIRADAPVRIFTGSGQNTTTDLFWGRNSGVWDNMGDCAQLVSDRGGRYRIRFGSASCAG